MLTLVGRQSDSVVGHTWVVAFVVADRWSPCCRQRFAWSPEDGGAPCRRRRPRSHARPFPSRRNAALSPQPTTGDWMELGQLAGRGCGVVSLSLGDAVEPPLTLPTVDEVVLDTPAARLSSIIPLSSPVLELTIFSTAPPFSTFSDTFTRRRLLCSSSSCSRRRP